MIMQIKLSTKFLNTLLSRYQIELETLMKGIDFIFDAVSLLYYKCRNFKSRGSYTESPDWIKNKKIRISPKNKDNKCLKYTVTVVSSFHEIEKDP